MRLATRCRIPPITKTATTLAKSLYDNWFAVVTPKLWNITPSEITSCSSTLPSLKYKLTVFLKSRCTDLPPVEVYSSPNNNSILDWKMRGPVRHSFDAM